MAYTNYILWGDDVPGAMGVHEAGAHQSCSLDDEFPALRKTVRGYLTPRLLLALGADYYADVFQPIDADLTAIAALSGTGIAVRTAANAWALRTLQAPAAGLTITNPAGVAGDMTFALANDLAALEGLASTGIAVRTAANTWAQRTIAVGSGLAIADAGGVAGNPTVTLDATLVSLAAFNTNGLLTQTAADTFTGRTLQAPAAGFSITNPAGIAGDPTFALTNDLSAVEGLSGTGFGARTGTDAWSVRTLTAPAAGLSITNPAGIAGDPTFALANDLAALEGLASTGIPARTATDTWALRTIAVGSGLAIADAGGVAGNPTVTLDATLVSLAAFNTNGLLTQTAADTFTGRTLQAPAAGFTITNPAGIAGDPTFVLANDLAALEGLGSTGIAVRSAANTWVQRSIAAGTGISVTNGDGVSGNPTVALSTPLTVPNGGTGVSTLTGLVKGNGTSPFSAAVAGTDYMTPAGVSAAYQPLDSDLTAIALLTTTSFGRALLELANAAALRTAAGLGTIATQNANAVAITGGSVTGITDLVVADGGTGVSTLTGLVKGNGTSAFSAAVQGTDYYAPGGADIAVADGGTGSSTASGARTNLGLVIGTDIQAYDAELAALAGLTSAADRLPYFTGSGTAALATFTAAGRALVDDADAAAQRTTLGLGTMAVETAANYVSKTATAAQSMVSALSSTVTGAANNWTLKGDAGTSISIQRHSTDASESAINLGKARNTVASPNAIVAGDVLGSYRGQGYDGVSAYRSGAEMRVVSKEPTPSATAMGAYIDFRTAAIGSITLTERVRLDDNGVSMGGANIVIDQNRLFRLRGYTVATLPAAGVAGRRAYVTNALAPAYNAAVVGGGAVVVPVFDNGAAWVTA